MANPNVPNGFLSTSVFASRPPHCELYTKPSSRTVGIFWGDVVYSLAGVSGEDRNPIASFADGATPGATVPLGVSLDGGAAGATGNANTKTHHLIIVERNQFYHAQDNDPTTGLLATDTHKNAVVDVSSVAGGVLPWWSGMQIDKSGVVHVPGSTSTYELALKGRWQGDPNNVFGPHCRFLVKFNEIEEGEGRTGS